MKKGRSITPALSICLKRRFLFFRRSLVLELRSGGSILLALLHDIGLDHLRRKQHADGDYHHLVEQPYDGYEVGYGVYGRLGTTLNVDDPPAGPGGGTGPEEDVGDTLDSSCETIIYVEGEFYHQT